MDNPVNPQLPSSQAKGQQNIQTDVTQKNMQENAKDILQKDLKSHQAKHPEHKGDIDTDQDKPSATGQRGILE